MPNNSDRSVMISGLCQLCGVGLLLLILAGCAPKTVPAEAPAGEVPAVLLQEVQSAPTEQLRGCRISETNTLQEPLRQDFAQAVALLQNGDFQAAIDQLEQIVATQPGVSAPHIDLAIAYRKTGRSEKAEAQLKQALELVPAHPVASNEYGLLLRSAGRFTEARELYQQALVVYPDYLPLRRNFGVLCDLYLNDPDCALEQFRYWQAAQPEDEEAGLWLSELQLRLGHQ